MNHVCLLYFLKRCFNMATKEGLFSYYYINLYCAICSSSVKSWAWEWFMSDYVYTYRMKSLHWCLSTWCTIANVALSINNTHLNVVNTSSERHRMLLFHVHTTVTSVLCISCNRLLLHKVSVGCVQRGLNRHCQINNGCPSYPTW